LVWNPEKFWAGEFARQHREPPTLTSLLAGLIYSFPVLQWVSRGEEDGKFSLPRRIM